MITDEHAFAETPTRAELTGAPLAELHALAAGLGVERYRLLRREALVQAILAADPAEPGAGSEPAAPTRRAPAAPFPGGRYDDEEDEDEEEDEEDEDEEDEEDDEDENDENDEDDEELEGEHGEPEPGPRERTRDRSAEQVEGTRVEGVFDPVPDGYGFLRVEGFVRSGDDVYVSQGRVRALGVRQGDLVTGTAQPPRRSERYPSLTEIESVNGRAAEDRDELAFDALTPIDADAPLPLAPGADDLGIRLTSLIAPIARGQRCLIVAPPGAGATTLLWSISRALASDAIVLLVDARPEEVTASRRELEGSIHVSSAEEAPAVHVKLAELALARAQRLVEAGSDVVLLLDSLSRLARAHQLVRGGGSASADGDRAESAVQAVKKWFASGRNTEERGSLTIVATVRTSTGSTLDELLHPALSEVATAELRLDERLAAEGLFPAIDVTRSYGRTGRGWTGEEERRQLRGSLLGTDPIEAWKRAADLAPSTSAGEALRAELDPGY